VYKLTLNNLCLGLLGGLLLTPSGALLSGGVRVELEHSANVVEWVLLATSLDGVGLLGGSENGLHFVALHHGLEVGVLDDSRRDTPVLLGATAGTHVTVDGVEGFERIFSEDEESSNVSTWSETENVQLVDVQAVDAWDVSEGLDDTVVLSVDDAWAQLLDVLAVSHLTSASSHSAGGVDSLDVVPSADGLEQIDGLLGLLVLLGVVGDNERDFWHVIDLVALGHDERWYAGGGDGRSHRVSALVDVTLLVPLSPGLEWGKHTTTSAHVTERGLAGSVGSATANTWDTCYGTTGTPGLGTGLFTGNLLDSVTLSRIFAQVGVHKVDEVGSNGGLEDGWSGDLAGGLAGLVVDGYLWARSGERHFLGSLLTFLHCKFDLRL